MSTRIPTIHEGLRSSEASASVANRYRGGAVLSCKNTLASGADSLTDIFIWIYDVTQDDQAEGSSPPTAQKPRVRTPSAEQKQNALTEDIIKILERLNE